MKQLMVESQVAHVLRVSATTLAAYRRRGIGPPWVRVGGKVLYSEDELRAWIREQSRPTVVLPSAAPEVHQT